MNCRFVFFTHVEWHAGVINISAHKVLNWQKKKKLKYYSKKSVATDWLCYFSMKTVHDNMLLEWFGFRLWRIILKIYFWNVVTDNFSGFFFSKFCLSQKNEQKATVFLRINIATAYFEKKMISHASLWIQ